MARCKLVGLQESLHADHKPPTHMNGFILLRHRDTDVHIYVHDIMHALRAAPPCFAEIYAHLMFSNVKSLTLKECPHAGNVTSMSCEQMPSPVLYKKIFGSFNTSVDKEYVELTLDATIQRRL